VLSTVLVPFGLSIALAISSNCTKSGCWQTIDIGIIRFATHCNSAPGGDRGPGMQYVGRRSAWEDRSLSGRMMQLAARGGARSLAL
jgi:hypothetical protein